MILNKEMAVVVGESTLAQGETGVGEPKWADNNLALRL